MYCPLQLSLQEQDQTLFRQLASIRYHIRLLSKEKAQLPPFHLGLHDKIQTIPNRPMLGRVQSAPPEQIWSSDDTENDYNEPDDELSLSYSGRSKWSPAIKFRPDPLNFLLLFFLVYIAQFCN